MYINVFEKQKKSLRRYNDNKLKELDEASLEAILFKCEWFKKSQKLFVNKAHGSIYWFNWSHNWEKWNVSYEI